jgi:hypothetical protein
LLVYGQKFQKSILKTEEVIADLSTLLFSVSLLQAVASKYPIAFECMVPP